MTLELLDESKIKKTGIKKDIKIEPDIKSDVDKKSEKVEKTGLEIIEKENIINCERTSSGMTNNCALCKELNNEMFNKCSNKYL
jgi:hypothetical protein